MAAPKSAFLWGSTPFLCARAKKWGGTGSRGKRLLPKETAHTYQPPTSTKPSPKSGEKRPVYRGSSAHANGGAARVKKALVFGGSTPFLWASTKEMGSKGRKGQRQPPNLSAHTQKAKTRQHLICAVTCAPISWEVDFGPYCQFHPISLLLRKETGWSPKETRFWVPPREMFGPARLSHGLEAPTSPPTA